MAIPLMVDATDLQPTAAETAMYGTLATFRIKPGAEQELAKLAREWTTLTPAGFVANYIYLLSPEERRYTMTVVFVGQSAYEANAASPEQHARYLKFRDLLIDDPVWQDGEIVFAVSAR